jgi:ribulose-5-phosphate 4-epimerase/fuculose-1-phosphate aldolase
MLKELREKLRDTAIGMSRAGLVVGSDGNVSAKDPETGYIAITPSGMAYEETEVDDFVIVDVEGKVIWGNRKPSWETPMHTYIHKHRDDVFAIMHTHAPYATLFAIANQEIPPVTMNLAAHFGGTVPCVPYVRTGSPEMGPMNLEYLGLSRKAVLLGNHGTLCIAQNLDKVLQLSEVLEEGAKFAYQAALLGNMVPLPEEETKWLFDLVASFEVEATEKEKEKVGSHP